MEWFLSHSTKQSRLWGLVFGVIVAIICVCGAYVYRTNSLFGASASVLALGLVEFVCVAAVVAVLAALFFAALPRLSAAGAAFPLSPRTTFIALCLALFAVWLLCLRAYWPGLLTYDIPTQIDMVFSGSWSTQQPPLHTLILAFFFQLEGLAGLHSITWYTFFQMLCLAAALAYLVSFMVARGAKTWFVVLVLVFLLLNPVLALFAITPTKDVFLGVCLIPLMLELVQLVESPNTFFASPAPPARLALWLVLSCLFRSNIAIVAFIFAGLACIVLRRYWKQVALLFGASLLCVVLVAMPGYRLLGIGAGGSAAASVPVQQVARVLVNHVDELPANELAVIEDVLPVEEAIKEYNPRFADKVVRLFKGRKVGLAPMMQKVVEAGKVWAAWGVRYPADYMDAFICLNVPYWYPFAQTPDPYSERAYIETQRWKESDYYTVELPNPQAPLYGFYEKVADYSAFAGTPLAAVFSPAMPFFYLALALCALLAQRERPRRALALAFLLVFWLSFVFGPVSNMRYMLPLFALYPLLGAFILQAQAVFGERGLAASHARAKPEGGEAV